VCSDISGDQTLSHCTWLENVWSGECKMELTMTWHQTLVKSLLHSS